MVSLLWMISFLLHIVLIMAVSRLFRQLQLEKQQNKERLETLSETVLTEMKLVNQTLEQWSETKRMELQADYDTHNKDAPVFPRKVNPHDKTKDRPVDQVEAGAHMVGYQQKKIEDQQEAFHPSVEGKALQLANRGLSIDEIAKQLARGKTEVELMLKMMQHKR